MTDTAQGVVYEAEVFADRAALVAAVEQALSTSDVVVEWPEHDPSALGALLAAPHPAVVVARATLADIAPLAPTADVYPVETADGTIGSLVVHPPTAVHPRDFGAAGWNRLAQLHPSPMRLAALRACARSTIGFYAAHEPRVWEYPAIADLIFDLAPPGARVADIGAGVSPLAPYLTDHGYHVETIDPSPHIRTWPPAPDWNEWDYLDYASAGLAAHSWNTTLDHIPEDRRFEVVYSVSVIEHLLGAQRRELLAEAHRRLTDGGVLLLTVDLVRGRTELWNRNRGAEVEPAAAHGTFDDLAQELRDCGFELLAHEAVRGWGTVDVSVDIGLVAARTSGQDPSSARARSIAASTLRA